MSLNIRVDTNARDIARQLGVFRRDIQDKAMVRGLNLAARKMRTQSKKEIRAVYNIKPGVINKASKVEKAGGSRRIMSAGVRFTGKRIALSEFQPQAINPWNVKGRRGRTTGGGVTVQIKRGGARSFIPSAFITRAKSGHKIVLTRLNATGTTKSRKSRGGRTSPRWAYPVRELTTLDVPTAVTQPRVLEPLHKYGFEVFRKEFIRQIALLYKQAK